MAKRTEAKQEEMVKVVETPVVKSLLQPINSEKALRLSHGGIYVFKVPMSMSKQEILRTVAQEFKVKTLSATVSVRKGKLARAAKGRRRLPVAIRKADERFAYVRLAAGEKLPFFDEPKEEKKGKK